MKSGVWSQIGVTRSTAMRTSGKRNDRAGDFFSGEGDAAGEKIAATVEAPPASSAFWGMGFHGLDSLMPNEWRMTGVIIFRHPFSVGCMMSGTYSSNSFLSLASSAFQFGYWSMSGKPRSFATERYIS